MMKLHLGCGKFYKEGYINIDAFDKTVADLKASIDDLKFPSNSIETIEAYQVIEHLGYMNSLYVLSEWFRVLKPEGILIIETPDIEKSFQKYLKTKNEIKKRCVLNWIFGIEAEGMTHKFCFSYDLLKELLKNIGFSEIRREKSETHIYEPGMRLVCKKPSDFKIHQIMALTRKRLKNKKIVDVDDISSVDIEKTILSKIKNFLLEYFKSKKERMIDNVIIETSIHNPTIVRIFLEECIKDKALPKNLKYIKILRFLEKINFPSILWQLFEELEKEPGKQKIQFNNFLKLAQTSVNKLLLGDRETTNKLSRIKTKRKIKIFSKYSLERESEKLSYQGIKYFKKGKYQNALKKFNQSLNLNADNLLSHWNLGRLFLLKKDSKSAVIAYKNALKSTHDKKRLNKIKIEMKNLLRSPELLEVKPIEVQ